VPDPARRHGANGLIQNHLSALNTELAERRARGHLAIYLCSCGFGTDDPDWLDGHLFDYPGHHRRSGASEVTL
jgi:hypothetical protein